MPGEAIRGILIPFFGTMSGSACVLFMRKRMGRMLQRVLTGFAAGVMVAASIWSLLVPAMEQAAHMRQWAFLPAVIGFWLGIFFLLLLDRTIPRMILQPIVENAVEHDITARRGGSLWVRACWSGERMVLEVKHDGTMNEEDRERIRALLSGDAGELACGVGLRNVHQRLKLIYGDEAALEVGETESGTILARIEFPAG